MATHVVSVSVTGNFYDMLPILRKLERTAKKKEHFERIYREEQKLVRKKISGVKNGPALKDYYAQQPPFIKRKLEVERKRQMKRNMGIAFLTFDSH